MAWRVDIIDHKTSIFLNKLSSDVKNEIGSHFLQMAKMFDQAGRSIKLCTSGIYYVQTYKVPKQKLSITYHIDNNEKVIRITGYELLAQ